MNESIIFINCIDTINEIFNFIKNKKPGMYLRFGDGDFNLSENLNDLLARPNDNIKNMILDSMSIRDERVFMCIPHHCKKINTLEEGMYPGNHEYPYNYIERFLRILKSRAHNLPNKIYTNVALSYCSVYHPDLVIDLHKEIQKSNIIYIGNYLYSDDFLKKIFGQNITRINTNSNNAFDQLNFVMNELNNLLNGTNEKFKQDKYFIIVIASGCASRAFSSVIYNNYFLNNPNFFLFDYGSLLDYLYGLNTRSYMNLMPPNKDYILNKI